MTAETIEEYKAYLAANHWAFNLKLDENRLFSPYYDNPETKCVELPFPTKASRFAHLAVTFHLLSGMDSAQWGGGTLIYTDWGIWDQRGNLSGYQMVERIRATFGEYRPFATAPVNRFRGDEQFLLPNFVLAALVYGWDACYVPNYGGCFAYISHDEWGCIVTETQKDFENISAPLLSDPELGYSLREDIRFCRPNRIG
jgi:hypothetical protein